MNRGRSRWLRAIVAPVMAIVLAGCGVPIDRQPHAISPDKVPYNLLERATTTTSSTTTLQVPTVDVPVYFVRNSRLVEATRAVTQSPSVNKAVNALLAGPSVSEENAGVRTALSPGIKVEVGRVEQGVVSINLGTEFSKLAQQEQLLALAQLVWTATGIQGVTGVQFSLDGEAIGVPLPDGVVVTGPVNRDAYAAIGPNAPPP